MLAGEPHVTGRVARLTVAIDAAFY